MLPYATGDFLSQPPPMKRAKVDPFGGDGSSTHGASNNTTSTSRLGRWTPDEKLLFLHGLSIYGKGKWKKIRQFLPSRTLVQIKSHAQKVLKREADGEDVMAPLKTDKERLNKLLSKGKEQNKGGLSASLLTVAQKLKPKSPQMGVFDHLKASPSAHGLQQPPKIIDRPMHLLADSTTASGSFRFRISENVPTMYGRYPQHRREPIYSTRLGNPPPPPPPPHHHHHMYYHDYHPHHHPPMRHPQHPSPHHHVPPPPHSPHRLYYHSGYQPHRTHFSFPPASQAPTIPMGAETRQLPRASSSEEQYMNRVDASPEGGESVYENAKATVATPTATPPNEQADVNEKAVVKATAATTATTTETTTTSPQSDDEQPAKGAPTCVTPERRTKHVDIMAAAALCQLAKKRRRSDDLPYMVSP